MKKPDSKSLWLELKRDMKKIEPYVLGDVASSILYEDPKMLLFILSRYKFVSKMLANRKNVLEVGCGDGFGLPIVLQTVQRVVATDIDENTLNKNQIRMQHFKNLEFKYHDFRASSSDKKYDGVYLVDVIEHIFPEEESSFIENITESITDGGVLICGCPNVSAEKYASQRSSLGHVNLKSGSELKSLFERYFKNVFLFGMNDEVLHTGFDPMCNYLWVVCSK